MKACHAYYKRYMSLMDSAKRCTQPSMRKSLYNEAQLNLMAFFDAVEDELERKYGWAR